MRMVVADRPGSPEVLKLTETPDPHPTPGQVRIAVEYAAVTFIDTQLRAGTSAAPPPGFPVVLGNGVGGRIDEVGDDVDRDWLGTAVVAATGGTGGYASAVVIEPTALHRVPTNLALAEATAVLADGRTALALIRRASITADDMVIVTAAAGGVGTLLVQLASAAGAGVIALAGSDDKLIHAREHGAQQAINYRHPDWERQLTGGAANGVTTVFDGVGGSTSATLTQQLRSAGHYLQYGTASGAPGNVSSHDLGRRHITMSSLADLIAGPEDNASLVDTALDLAAQGRLRPVIGQTYPLAAAASAHTDIEARHTNGKTLLLP
ncbi:NADPH2:quinone reductase [Halopolyspora algeriensis]|uniref:NADPH2:quinone reductase n=1 Tax=Halopolyspora algeriensis TaxID=1500506 RepID=A0A368VEK5_9ACTN|nr:zinc-binding dehydrogenase [Halopolyspora algeriensis]RCW39133.1 NADPH2:quinone reductase [Halopolyspora algeriensis]TQM56570.1 NADPH2:quinone reductase [Halopolyspora algeriensis]